MATVPGTVRLVRKQARTEGRLGATHNLSARWAWTIAGVIAVSLLYATAILFVQTPLPGPARFTGWFPDLAFDLNLSAEALHHWPLTDPSVSGTRLPYQNFVYMHLASIAQVTGIRLPVLLLRLYLVLLLVVFVLALSWAGRALTGQVWSGPVAAGLLLLVGEVNPTSSHLLGVNCHFLIAMLFSPTFLLGLVFFVPAVVLIAERVNAIPQLIGERRPWLVLTLLLLGCSGAKATILPVLLGGLLVYIACRGSRDHRFDWEAGKVFVLVLGVLVASYAVFYQGHNEGLKLNLMGTASELHPLARLARVHVPILSTLLWIVANGAVVLVFCAVPLAGLVWLMRDRKARAARSTMLLAGLFAAGLVPLFIFSAPGQSQLWFTYYGYVAGALLSAQGLCVFLRSQHFRPWWPGLNGVRYGVVWTIVILAMTTWLAMLHGPGSGGYAVWVAVIIAASVVLVLLATRAMAPPRSLVILIILPICAYGVLSTPVHIAPELVEEGSEPSYTNQWGTVPGGLTAGLEWLRTHSKPADVLAVNNYYLDKLRQDPGYLYYSALSERRVFLEGWSETIDSIESPGKFPFPERRRLNDAVFQRANEGSLSELSLRYHVRFLVVDKIDGTASTNLRKLARLVYVNHDVAIYAVRR